MTWTIEDSSLFCSLYCIDNNWQQENEKPVFYLLRLINIPPENVHIRLFLPSFFKLQKKRGNKEMINDNEKIFFGSTENLTLACPAISGAVVRTLEYFAPKLWSAGSGATEINGMLKACKAPVVSESDAGSPIPIIPGTNPSENRLAYIFNLRFYFVISLKSYRVNRWVICWENLQSIYVKVKYILLVLNKDDEINSEIPFKRDNIFVRKNLRKLSFGKSNRYLYTARMCLSCHATIYSPRSGGPFSDSPNLKSNSCVVEMMLYRCFWVKSSRLQVSWICKPEMNQNRMNAE